MLDEKMRSTGPVTESAVLITQTMTVFYLAKAWRDMACSVFELADKFAWFLTEPGQIPVERPWEECTDRRLERPAR
jgi:hypothetical protein